MKEIGGYFELELSSGKEFHADAIKLNSGRNCFKYILIAQEVSKVYIPNYICDSMIETLKELDIEFDYYYIDEKFEIIGEIVLEENEKLLYVNYYALKSKYIHQLSSRYDTKLIVDNSQSFFNLPIKNVDTFYSPRKFFGVSQGGYLYADTILDKVLEEDYVDKDVFYLIGRADTTASQFLKEFHNNESSLVHRPIRAISKFTHKMLMSIDYNSSKIKRERNFLYLHSNLNEINILKINLSGLLGPMIYPLLLEKEGLKQYLIDHKVYVATYWQEVLSRCETGSMEEKFTRYLLPLPVDQRYGLAEMEKIVQLIKNYKGKNDGN